MFRVASNQTITIGVVFMGIPTGKTRCIPLRLLCVNLLSFLFFISPAAADDPHEDDAMATLLSMSLEELIDVEISVATRTPQTVRKAPAIASVITAREIHNMGARNLRDILAMQPGFGVSRNEFGIFMYEVRGIRTQLSEKILVMIDGHSLNKSIITGSALYRIFDDLPVENIKQVEIIRGPGSALYGANAFVGVINIITRDAADIDGLELKASGGSFATRKINAVGGKTFANGLQASGSLDYYKTDGAKFLIEQDALTGTPFTTTPGYAFTEIEKKDLFFKASYKDLAFKAHYMDNRKDGFYIGFNHVLTDDSTDPITNFWSEVSYSPELTDRLQAVFMAYIDYYKQETSAEIFPEGFLGIFPNGMIGGPWVKNQTIGGEVQLDYDVSADNHLVGGALFERTRQYDVKSYNNFDPTTGAPLPSGQVEDVSALGNWNVDEDRNVWALYVQDEWQIRDNLNLTAGVRHDHYSDFGGTTNPRLGLVWSFLENADLKLLYGQAFRAPNFAELYNQNNPVEHGNPDLDPEKIKTYELGAAVRLLDNFTVNLNYFYNDIDDLIIVDKSAAPPIYVNAGSAEVNGVELILSGNYSPENYWKLSYTYQDPRDGATGARLPDVPSHRATAAINYGLNRYVNLHTDILWTGPRPRQAGDTRAKTSSYTTVDLALTLKNFYRTLEIQGVIHNLFDQDYVDPDTSGAAQLIPNDFPRAGISAMVNVSYKF
jgi:outer membrane cobalamin receptor